MVRAFAFCAVILVASTAAAQTVAPKIISQPQPDEQLGIPLQEPTPVSGCDEHGCPNSDSIASADPPVDKHALLKQKLAELNCLQSEIDQLRAATGTPQQILVKLQAIEVSRTKLQKLRIDTTALRGNERTNPRFQGFTTIDDTSAVAELVSQLRNNNIAKVLAEPNIVVVSGRPALFNVGGEVPLPLPPGSQQAVEFKQFGTQIDILAIANGDDRVHLDLRARIGEIDASRQIEINGVKVPAISVRQIDTGVDLKFGQTGVFSGMVQKRTERQKRENKTVDVENEIELLFVVTPELVATTDVPQHASTSDAAAYRTATSDSEERPKERSLRVTKPYTPR